MPYAQQMQATMNLDNMAAGLAVDPSQYNMAPMDLYESIWGGTSPVLTSPL